ncbi:MAG TPA: glutamate 5-kinase [Deltaproteobacteria bacterium]|nr:glutamate 5-kinase [Deltaproteobacteria bacterium]
MHEAGGDAGGLDALAAQVRGLKERGMEVAVVTSGAVALGVRRLGLGGRPVSIPRRQAVAALGQSALMSLYERAFAAVGERAAQVLLTHDDMGGRRRFINAKNTLTALFELGIVPVINENDTVAVEEIKYGDNDTLAALVTNLIEADLLVILSDIDGLYDRNPRRCADARRIPLVENVDELRLDEAASRAGPLGSGGIASKVEAARKAAHFGAATVIANGLEEDVLLRVASGEDRGTLFLPREEKLTSKKHWIAFSTRPTGRIFVDDGAKTALVEGGKSLLPSGVRRVDGQFEAGEVVHCVDMAGMEFARGVANYGSGEIEAIKGRKSSEISAILGYSVYDEVIHRDNLVVL